MFNNIFSLRARKLSDAQLRAQLDSPSRFGRAQFQREFERRKALGNFGQTPSVVQTAGVGGMGGRINSIESRLAELEKGASAGIQNAATPPIQAAPEISTQEQAPMVAGADMAASPDMAETAIAPVTENIEPAIPAADALGEKFSSSPFFKRQRTNMGPLMFKDQTGDGKITRADVIKARIEGYKE